MLTPNVGVGGAEKVFYDHARAFETRGAKLREITFRKEGDERYFGPLEKVTALDNPSSAGGNPASRFLVRKRALENLWKSDRTQVAVGHMEGANLLIAAARGQGVLKIGCVHGTLLGDTAKTGIRRWLLNRLFVPVAYNRLNYVVAVSRGIAAELVHLGVQSKRVRYIPNYFDAESIASRASEVLPPEWARVFHDNQVLINVGRLAPQKNQLALLRVFAAAHKKNPRLRLVIVGDGPLKNALPNAAAALGLRTWISNDHLSPDPTVDVFFTGNQSNPHKFLSRAAAFLLTSTHEGLPLVLGEAMACGVPVIAVDCPTGPAEMLRAAQATTPPLTISSPATVDCGILMPPLKYDALSIREADQWMEAISTVITDEALRMRMIANGQERLREYREDHVISEWLTLMQCA